MKEDHPQLENNLVLLHKSDAKLAIQITLIEPELEWCKTAQDELNLKRVYEGKTYFYHSEKGAMDEAHKWFAALDLQGVETLFVYGVGLGYYYTAAKQWLKDDPKREIVFLEQDLSILYCFLELKLAEEFLSDPQVKLATFTNIEEDKEVFIGLAWRYWKDQIAFSALKLYQEANEEGCQQLEHKINQCISQSDAFADEYLKYGVPFFHNFYPNLLELPNAFLGNALFDSFKDVPAIICGAGPSLDKNGELLHDLRNKAILFAGSSSLSALIPRGIIPHFAVGVDPTKWQEPRLALTQPFQTPVFYRNRLYPGALNAIQGPRLYLTGSGGYEIGEWFDSELGIEGANLDEGHGVVNFTIEIARALGCNPILLVGVDLALSGEQVYSKHVVESLKLSKEDLDASIAKEERRVMREDIYGEPVVTLGKWLTESAWITSFAESHPEVTLINCTEGGIGAENVPDMSLEEAADQHLKEIPHLEEKIQKMALTHPLSKLKVEGIKKVMIELRESLKRSIDLLNQLIVSEEELKTDIFHHRPYPETLQTTKITLLESDLEDEVASQAIFGIFNQVYVYSHLKEIQDLESWKNPLSEEATALAKISLQQSRLTFLKEVAHINIALINMALGEPYEG